MGERVHPRANVTNGDASMSAEPSFSRASPRIRRRFVLKKRYCRVKYVFLFGLTTMTEMTEFNVNPRRSGRSRCRRIHVP
jgi:hypothetical protein